MKDALFILFGGGCGCGDGMGKNEGQGERLWRRQEGQMQRWAEVGRGDARTGGEQTHAGCSWTAALPVGTSAACCGRGGGLTLDARTSAFLRRLHCVGLEGLEGLEGGHRVCGDVCWG